MAARGNSSPKSPIDGDGLSTLFEKLNLHSVTYATSLDIPVTAYDNYALEFQEIIASAKAVLDIRSGGKSSNSLPLFTPEMGIIQPLFFATLKYRNSFWREQALKLLRKSGREGPWCGAIEAQILDVVIAAEESTLDKLSSNFDEPQPSMPSTDVPEDQRVHLCLVQDYLDRRYESITLDKGAGSPARFAKVQLCKCRDLEGMLSDETRGPRKDFWADERYWDTWHKNVPLPE
uniref:Uncharacterized protein n=1 Tax=Fusarium oxysporum (strain Fo5176) TaxID=660025 RepID=A0A0D2Y9Y6_FUSOF